TRDGYCPAEALHRLGEATGAQERLIEGADHFFFGKLYPRGEAVGGWRAGAGGTRASRAPPISSPGSSIRWARRSGPGWRRFDRPRDQSRSRGSREGVAGPAERVMGVASPTVSPVGSVSSFGTTMTSPRYRLLVGTNTVTICRFPSTPSISSSDVTKPNTYSPLRGCSASTTALNELRFWGEKDSSSCFTDG